MNLANEIRRTLNAGGNLFGLAQEILAFVEQHGAKLAEAERRADEYRELYENLRREYEATTHHLEELVAK